LNPREKAKELIYIFLGNKAVAKQREFRRAEKNAIILCDEVINTLNQLHSLDNITHLKLNIDENNIVSCAGSEGGYVVLEFWENVRLELNQGTEPSTERRN